LIYSHHILKKGTFTNAKHKCCECDWRNIYSIWNIAQYSIWAPIANNNWRKVEPCYTFMQVSHIQLWWVFLTSRPIERSLKGKNIFNHSWSTTSWCFSQYFANKSKDFIWVSRLGLEIINSHCPHAWIWDNQPSKIISSIWRPTR